MRCVRTYLCHEILPSQGAQQLRRLSASGGCGLLAARKQLQLVLSLSSAVCGAAVPADELLTRPLSSPAGGNGLLEVQLSTGCAALFSLVGSSAAATAAVNPPSGWCTVRPTMMGMSAGDAEGSASAGAAGLARTLATAEMARSGGGGSMVRTHCRMIAQAITVPISPTPMEAPMAAFTSVLLLFWLGVKPPGIWFEASIVILCAGGGRRWVGTPAVSPDSPVNVRRAGPA